MGVRTVHLALSSDENYLAQLAVTMHSVMLRSDPSRCYVFHVLTPMHVDLGDAPQIAAVRMRHANCTVDQIRLADEAVAPFLAAAQVGRYAASTYYRLLLDKLLPDVSKCLYLDCDVVALDDVATLFDHDLGNRSAAAVRDPICGLSGRFAQRHQRLLGFPYDGMYFCAGVILLNLDKLRVTGALERAIGLDLGSFPLVDQDALNTVLRGDVDLVPLRYDVLAKEYREGTIHRCGCYSALELAEVDGGGICVLHFAGPEDKPWNLMHSSFARPWLDVAEDILPADVLAGLRAAFRRRMDSASLSAIVERCRSASRVHVFGFTPQGRHLVDLLRSCGVGNVAGFLDNEPDKAGCEHAGVPCLPAAEIEGIVGPDDLIVIAAQTAHNAIRKDLLARGFDPAMVCRYIHKGPGFYEGMRDEWVAEELAAVQRDLACRLEDGYAELAELPAEEFASRLFEPGFEGLRAELHADLWLAPGALIR